MRTSPLSTRFNCLNRIIPYNINLNYIAPAHGGMGILHHHLPNLKGNTVFIMLLLVLATQLKCAQNLYFNSNSPLVLSLPWEDAVYIFLCRYFSLSCHLTNFVGLQGIYGITKRALNPVPVTDILVGTRENCILDLFNSLSNELILSFSSLDDFTMKHCQSPESVNVLD